jgi:hypothetical protein
MVQTDPLERFLDRLDGNLAIRRAELQKLSLLIMASDEGSDLRNLLARSGVLLAYSHWEGYIRDASRLYIEYLNSLDLVMSDVKPVFKAMALRRQISDASGAKKVTSHAMLIEALDASTGEKFAADPSKCIKTDSNLSSIVFKEIVLSLGLSYLAAYELREKYIDRVLGERRHGVAHGELRRIDSDDFEEFLSGVMRLLMTYRRQLEDAARRQTYKRTTSHSASALGMGETLAAGDADRAGRSAS